MDINQQMQTWRKDILLHPILNKLLDSQLTGKDLLHQHILTQDHQTVINIYTKLASFKHSLSKGIHKQVQLHSTAIEYSFQNSAFIRQDIFDNKDKGKLQDYNYLEKYNHKYVSIEQDIVVWNNTTKLLYYAKAVSKYKTNLRIIRNQINANSQKIKNNLYIMNIPKITRLYRQTKQLSEQHDFSHLKGYEEERIFLHNTKMLLYNNTEKELRDNLNRISDDNYKAVLEEISNKIIVLNELGKLKDFIVGLYRADMNELGDKLKTALGRSGLKQPNGMSQLCAQMKSVRLDKTLIRCIVVQQAIECNGIKECSMNILSKMCNKVIQYLSDTIKWNIQQAQPLQLLVSDPYTMLNNILWKYPFIVTFVENDINNAHLFIVSHVLAFRIEFISIKTQFMMALTPLALKYYQAIDSLFTQKVNIIKENHGANQTRLSDCKQAFYILETLLPGVSNEDVFTYSILKMCNAIKDAHSYEDNLQMARALKRIVQNSPTLLNSISNYKILLYTLNQYGLLENEEQPTIVFVEENQAERQNVLPEGSQQAQEDDLRPPNPPNEQPFQT